MVRCYGESARARRNAERITDTSGDSRQAGDYCTTMASAFDARSLPRLHLERQDERQRGQRTDA